MKRIFKYLITVTVATYRSSRKISLVIRDCNFEFFFFLIFNIVLKCTFNILKKPLKECKYYRRQPK